MPWRTSGEAVRNRTVNLEKHKHHNSKLVEKRAEVKCYPALLSDFLLLTGECSLTQWVEEELERPEVMVINTDRLLG